MDFKESEDKLAKSGNSFLENSQYLIPDIINCSSNITALSWSGDNLVISGDGHVELWDVNDARPIQTFENHDGKNISSNDNIFNEGSFYGTYIVGPILVRNPELCSLFVHKLIDSKEKDFEYKDEDYEYEKEAYKKAVEII